MKCFEDYPFLIIEYNTCTADCNCKDFFNGICTLNNLKNSTQSLLIENIIKNEYNISSNETLIIFKIEKSIEGLLIPLTEYEIFNPETMEIIDLTKFQNINLNIFMNIPIFIIEANLFKFDPNNRYYNDICYTYTTENKTDLTLYDRKNEFNNENYSLCFMNCIYNGYDSINHKVICKCKLEGFLGKSEDNIINKFEISMKSTNFNILKCYKLLFSKEGLIKNIVNYIILLIIILFLYQQFIFI